MNRAKVQIVLDCRGEAVVNTHLRLLEGSVGCVLGAQRLYHSYYVTRTDLLSVAVEIVTDHAFKQGDAIRANGYDGAIVRRYSPGMYEVRLPGGVACVSASDIICYQEIA